MRLPAPEASVSAQKDGEEHLETLRDGRNVAQSRGLCGIEVQGSITLCHLLPNADFLCAQPRPRVLERQELFLRSST